MLDVPMITPKLSSRSIIALLFAVVTCGGCAKSAVTNAESSHDGGNAPPLSDSGVSDSWPESKYLSVVDVHEFIQGSVSNVQLINVVDEEYYSLGHIANSLKIPWDVLSSNLSQVDKNRHVILYCRRGVRSESAYDTLRSNGYTLVWIMEGGIEAWIAAGYPTVSD